MRRPCCLNPDPTQTRGLSRARGAGSAALPGETGPEHCLPSCAGGASHVGPLHFSVPDGRLQGRAGVPAFQGTHRLPSEQGSWGAQRRGVQLILLGCSAQNKRRVFIWKSHPSSKRAQEKACLTSGVRVPALFLMTALLTFPVHTRLCASALGNSGFRRF